MPVQPFVWEDHPDAAFAVLLWTFVAFGISRLARRGAAPVAIVVGPVVALLIASALERYPVAPRVCLFAAPLFFLIDAAAVDWALARWPAGWPRRGVMMVTSLWVVTVGALGVSKQYGTPPTRLQVEEFKRRAMPGEPVYVFAGAVPTWTRYSTDWHAVDRAALTTIIASQAVDGGAFHNAPSRGRAVDDTAGTSLLVRVDGRVELLGLASGVQWRESFDVHRDRPDPGWGEREAARLRAVTDSTAWVAIAYAYPGVARVLLDAIERAGGREEFHWSAPPALLMRYRFPPHERKFFVPAP